MHIYRSTPHCSICNSFIKPDHPVVDTPEPIIPKTLAGTTKPNTRQVKSDDDSSIEIYFHDQVKENQIC